ncbi:MAG TPA: glycosyltransferase family 39 protein, partial [Burkholderiaceae bacterium]|nr:glycosyltransferase family 39 protein [Burkholderiaceae bacterium]
MNRPPVRLTEQAVAKFPRWVLFAIMLAYALPGLFGRDPWRSDDAIGFGVMWTMAQGSWRDWLIPNVVGAPFFDDGPL